MRRKKQQLRNQQPKKQQQRKQWLRNQQPKKQQRKKNNPFLSPLVRNGEAAIVFKKPSRFLVLDIITFVMLSVKIRNFSSHYRYIESTERNSDLSKPLIACQLHLSQTSKCVADCIRISQFLKRFNLLHE